MTGGEEGVLGTETHDSLSKGFSHGRGDGGISRLLGRVVGEKNPSSEGAEDRSRGGIEVDFAARAERASARVSVTHTKKVE